ncbi:MAG: hypothetical protein RJS98_02615, partial [Rhodospirillaceae bacterium]
MIRTFSAKPFLQLSSKSSLLLTSGLIALTASPALAQNAAEGGPRITEEIVVTATRTGSAIENLPVSVSVIDQEKLAEQ